MGKMVTRVSVNLPRYQCQCFTRWRYNCKLNVVGGPVVGSGRRKVKQKENKNATGRSSTTDRFITYKLDSWRPRWGALTRRRVAPGPANIL